MKTNGLRNKKPAMARAAWRVFGERDPWQAGLCEWNLIGVFDYGEATYRAMNVARWHRAAKGRK